MSRHPPQPSEAAELVEMGPQGLRLPVDPRREVREARLIETRLFEDG